MYLNILENILKYFEFISTDFAEFLSCLHKWT